MNVSIADLYGELNRTQVYAKNVIPAAVKAVDVQLEVLEASVNEAQADAETNALDIEACVTQEEQAAGDVSTLQLDNCLQKDEILGLSNRIGNLKSLNSVADTIVTDCFEQDEDDSVKDPAFLRTCIKSSIDNVQIDLDAQVNQLKKDIEDYDASVDPCVLRELAEIDMDILQIAKLFFVCVNVAESKQPTASKTV